MKILIDTNILLDVLTQRRKAAAIIGPTIGMAAAAPATTLISAAVALMSDCSASGTFSTIAFAKSLTRESF